MKRLQFLSLTCLLLGLANATPAATPGTLKWTYTARNAITASSPVLGTDQTVFISDWQNGMYALNAANGTAKWVATAPAGYYLGDNSPALSRDGQTVYFSYYGTALTARSAITGLESWTYYIPSPTNGSPTISKPAVGPDGSIYFVGYDFRFYALRSNGTLKWVIGLPNGADTSCRPTVGPDGTVYTGDFGGGVVGLNPTTGATTITYTTDGGGVSGPTIAPDGTVYALGYGGLYAYYANGTRKWKFTNTSLQSQFPNAGIAIDSYGVVYFECRGYLYAVNPDGTQKWQFYTQHSEQNSGYSIPVIGWDGTIYVGSPSHLLYAVNSSGTLRWSFTAGDKIYSSPAIGNDGTIYFGCLNGYVYALNGSGNIAQLICIDFDNPSNLPASAKSGPAAVGNPGDFWNLFGCPWQSFAGIANLANANYTSTTVGLQASNLPGCWAVSSTDPMYSGYIYNGGSPASITITNLPAGNWNVYAYAVNGANYQLSVGSTSYGTTTSTYNYPVVNPPPWVQGMHYVAYINVVVSPGQSMVLNMSASPYDGYTTISGLQLARMLP